MAESPVSRFIYRAFISYSHRDKAWVAWLHRSLGTRRVPCRNRNTKAINAKYNINAGETGNGNAAIPRDPPITNKQPAWFRKRADAVRLPCWSGRQPNPIGNR
jgi:hypothetical protein